MDADRFDALVRSLGRAPSRRALLRVLAAGAGALLGPAARGHVGSAPYACGVAACKSLMSTLHAQCVDDCKKEEDRAQAGCLLGCEADFHLSLQTCDATGGCFTPFERCCGLQCLDIRSDPANCGACDVRCPPGQPCCDGACRIDDPANCGACGVSCPRSESGPGHCVNGQCHLCAPAETECVSAGGIFCVDLQLSPSNCGACGDACPGDQLCCAGACAAGMARCGGGCVSAACPGTQVIDPATCRCGCAPKTCDVGKRQDPATCACVCAAPCAAGQIQDPITCQCGCPAGRTACGAACADLRTDVLNCGSCGHACRPNEICAAGVCRCGPTTPDICEGVCTNFNYDPYSCGGCGAIFRCPQSNPFALPHCCPGRTIGTGICTDVHIDGDNCGRCGHACPGGKKCEGGACVCQAGTVECNGQCVAAGAPCGVCAQHELACGSACCASGLVCIQSVSAVSPGGLRAAVAAVPACVCPDGRDLCGGACCAAAETCAGDACAARSCQICEIEQNGQCYAVVCDAGQICVNDICVAGGNGAPSGMGCPPDWLDCASFCCPSNGYYCGDGCCFDPAVPCFPKVPKIWPIAGG